MPVVMERASEACDHCIMILMRFLQSYSGLLLLLVAVLSLLALTAASVPL